MSTSYYLLGPIDSSNSVILVVNVEKIPYFLNLTSDGDLIFDPRVGTPLVFGISDTTHGIFLTFSGSNQATMYVGTKWEDNAIVAVPSAKSETLIPSSPDVNEWADFLAGVHYTIHDGKGSLVSWKAYVPDTSSIQNGIPTSIEMDNGKPKIQLFTDTIRVIPTLWYESGTCSSTASSSSVISAETLWITETGTVPNGYTSLTDCQVGVRYSYCGKNIDCSKTCKGPCTTNGTSCDYDSKTDGFICMDPPPKEKPIYEKSWFIALAVIIALMLIAVFFLFLFRLK